MPERERVKKCSNSTTLSHSSHAIYLRRQAPSHLTLRMHADRTAISPS